MKAGELRSALLVLLLRLAARLPLGVLHALGVGLGLCLYALPTDSRRTARRNLELCFPRLDAGKRRALLRASLIETGKALLEASALWLWSTDRTISLVREVRGLNHLEAAFAAGRGVVVLGPHLGCWELTGLYCSRHYQMTSIYRPFRSGAVDTLMRQARERGGARLVPADPGGVLALRRALQRGEVVGILPDQDPPRRGGVFAPFFGVTTHTMTLACRLIRQSGAAAVFAFALRLPRGKGFQLHFRAAGPLVADEDLATAASALNRGVEQCIVESPAQYLWVYRRFKTRPSGASPLYPRTLVRRLRRRWRRRTRPATGLAGRPQGGPSDGSSIS